MISLQHTRFNTQLYNAKYGTPITYYIIHGSISVPIRSIHNIKYIDVMLMIN